jgi:hypothetical protein
MSEPENGINLHKGFKMLTEVFMNYKPDWFEFQYRVFKPLLPLRMLLERKTQTVL